MKPVCVQLLWACFLAFASHEHTHTHGDTEAKSIICETSREVGVCNDNAVAREL